MAQRYALGSLDEAREYAEHPLLGERLRQCARLVIDAQGREISEIFGYPDHLKLHSSITLFAIAVPEEPVFASVLTKYFSGKQDTKTLELLPAKK